MGCRGVYPLLLFVFPRGERGSPFLSVSSLIQKHIYFRRDISDDKYATDVMGQKDLRNSVPQKMLLK